MIKIDNVNNAMHLSKKHSRQNSDIYTEKKIPKK